MDAVFRLDLRETTDSDLFKILANRTDPHYFNQEIVLTVRYCKTSRQKQASANAEHISLIWLS